MSHIAFDFSCVPRRHPWLLVVVSLPHRRASPISTWAFTISARADAVDDAKSKRRLLDALAAAFPDLPIPAHGGYKAFPIRWYAPQQRFATERVLLAGDAAGVDPLMGEGISYAFEHGKLAAQALDAWFAGTAGALRGYDHALHRGAVARKLRRLLFAARRFYGPHHRLYFRLAVAQPRCATNRHRLVQRGESSRRGPDVVAAREVGEDGSIGRAHGLDYGNVGMLAARHENRGWVGLRGGSTPPGGGINA